MKEVLKKKIGLLLFTLLLLGFSVNANPLYNSPAGDEEIQGSWDITVYKSGKEYPSWLEVYHSGNNHLVGQFVGIVGSARPVSRINFKDNVISFHLPPQWEVETKDITYKGVLNNGSLSGLMTEANGETYSWTAVKAPLLLPQKTPVWGKPITLFNGKNLDGWTPLGSSNQWVVENGVLHSPHSGVNLVTKQKFNDFKLHIEFKCPTGSNSGVYLRGRYEVQIVDSKGLEPARDLIGAIYGFIIPTENASLPADQWQSYDITLTGRVVTVVLNGKTIICNRPIPGITGGALDSHEGEPGPIYLQGDHGPIEFRNIVLTPTK